MNEKIEFSDILKMVYSSDDFDYNSISHGDSLKECPLCHKGFYAIGRNKHLQRICNRTHYINCVICGQPIKQEHPSVCSTGLKPACKGECSKKFRANQTFAAIRDKYGVDNVSQSDLFKEKISAGIKAKAPQTTEKIKQVMKEKYGGMGTASPILRQKIESTMQERYGVTNPDQSLEFRKKISDKLKSDEVINKKKEASRLKWGVDYPAQSVLVQQQMMERCIELYGVPFPSSLPEVKAKAAQTCLEKFGVPYGFQTDYAVEKAREGFIKYKHDHNNKISKLNQAFAQFLKDNYEVEIEYEWMIHRKSYDFLVKNTKVLIELDPTYTHSDLPNHWTDEGKEFDYHLNRTKYAAAAGYRCIHVFDWDNWNKIATLVAPTAERIYARKCQLVEVEPKSISQFIADNHIQGKVSGATKAYGLYYNGELVEAMTFGRSRYNKKYEWELLRLCTKIRTTVVGGASRLFARFIEDAQPKSVISYCDIAKFSGNVYAKLGFVLDHTSAPAKVWSKGDRYVTDNLLRQRGYDQLFGTNYGKGTSNEELMIQNGWRSVYDCGQYVFGWHCNLTREEVNQ